MRSSRAFSNKRFCASMRSSVRLGGRKGAQHGGHMPMVRSPLRSSQAGQKHDCASNAFLRGRKRSQQGGCMPMVRFPLRSSWTIPESDRAPMRSSVAVKALSKADTCPWLDRRCDPRGPSEKGCPFVELALSACGGPRKNAALGRAAFSCNVI